MTGFWTGSSRVFCDARFVQGLRESIQLGLGLLMLLLGIFAQAQALGDDIFLKNGVILRGTAVEVGGLNILTLKQNNQGPTRNFPYWLIDDGVRRYFVPKRQVSETFTEDSLSGIITFKLTQEKTARSLALNNVDAFSYVEPFDNNGRRIVSFNTRQGPLNIIQGITEIRPDYVKVEGLTHVWNYALDTRSLPEETLKELIEKSTDRLDLAERRATVQFYVQGKFYTLAEQEVDSIIKDFPEQRERSEELKIQLAEEKARGALVEIQQRRSAGQHQLAFHIARLVPPERVSADVLRQAQDIVTEYESALLKRDRVDMLLTELESRLTPEEAAQARPLRSIVTSSLHYENISRLEPFLRAEQDQTLTPQQKLALAYSGWLLGSTNAVLEFNQAMRFWEGRFHVLEYLRESDNPLRRDELVSSMQEIEGLSVERIAQMIPQLPMAFEPPAASPGELIDVDVPVRQGEEPVRYSLILPPEYSPHKKYPLLVTLTSALRSPADEAHWWAGDETRPGWGQRRGYIVVAPHYCEESETSYNYGEGAHRAVLTSIDHVRTRFRVDSDRIFLAGHGMGGDACFDMAMSHPGIFAGVVPINGISDRYCMFYSMNDPHVAWYVVGGQRDRDSLERNARDMNKIMSRGQDVIYCDYKERGYESYFEELPRIFEWMETHRRPSIQETLQWGDIRGSRRVVSLRKTDNRFYWLEANALRDDLFKPIIWDASHRNVRPTEFYGTINPGGSIYVRHPGRSTTIWLSPEMVSFDERLRINVNGESKFFDYVKPSATHLLEELRLHGDRERLYWIRLDL